MKELNKTKQPTPDLNILGNLLRWVYIVTDCYCCYITKTSLDIRIYDFFAEPSDLEKLVDENPSSNFFIDEAPVAGKIFSIKTLADISKKVSRKNYLWIACQSDKVPHKQDANLAGNYWTLN